MITKEVENKMIKEGKTKDDLQGLPEAKRVARADYMARSASKIESKNEG